MREFRSTAAVWAVAVLVLVTQRSCQAYDCKKGCAEIKFKGDNYCDDANNKCGCDWDGGDCCGTEVRKKFCDICECLNPYWTMKTERPIVCLDPPCVVPSPTPNDPSPLVHEPSPDDGNGTPSGDPAPTFGVSELPAPDDDIEDEPSAQNVTQGGSCKGRCSSKSGHCWCDGACVRNGDCCGDYLDYCEHTTTSTHTGEPAPDDVDYEDELPAPDFNSTSTTGTTTTLDLSDRPAPDNKRKKHWPRTPGPTTTTTLSAWDFSCEGKCRLTLEKGTKGGCYCDQMCGEYNDCCHDWADYCTDFVFPARASAFVHA
jgi:hypothetical protein